MKGEHQCETKDHTVWAEKREKPLPHGGWALRTFQEGGKTAQAFSSGPDLPAAQRRDARGRLSVGVRVRVRRGVDGLAGARFPLGVCCVRSVRGHLSLLKAGPEREKETRK